MLVCNPFKTLPNRIGQESCKGKNNKNRVHYINEEQFESHRIEERSSAKVHISQIIKEKLRIACNSTNTTRSQHLFIAFAPLKRLDFFIGIFTCIVRKTRKAIQFTFSDILKPFFFVASIVCV